MTERRKVRWLIAHTPAYLFVRTAEMFREEIERMCPGEFDIEILTTDEYVETYNKLYELKYRRQGTQGLEEVVPTQYLVSGEKDNPKWRTYFDALRDGEFEISQTQISTIGRILSHLFTTIDLPFLFDDHDHVSRVLDNKVGDFISEHLVESSQIRGLGFTYSGGYRVMGSTDPISSIEEMTQTKVLSCTIPGNALFKRLGAKTLKKVSADYVDFVGDTGSKSIETTYLRFNGNHILKTNHSIFMTAIITGEKFFQTLTEKQQDAFRKAAKKCAVAEREWSIEDAAKYENEAKSKGIEIKELSQEDKNKLREAAMLSYEDVKDYTSLQLIETIKKWRKA
jgi:TRAP-type C4-dicarboxylate transport system substrate-binding protein